MKIVRDIYGIHCLKKISCEKEYVLNEGDIINERYIIISADRFMLRLYDLNTCKCYLMDFKELEDFLNKEIDGCLEINSTEHITSICFKKKCE